MIEDPCIILPASDGQRPRSSSDQSIMLIDDGVSGDDPNLDDDQSGIADPNLSPRLKCLTNPHRHNPSVT